MQFGSYRALKPLQLYPMLSYVTAWEAERDAHRCVLLAANGVAAHAQPDINAALLRDAEAASRAGVEAWRPHFIDAESVIAAAVWHLPLPAAITLEGLLFAVTGEGSRFPTARKHETSDRTLSLRAVLRDNISQRGILSPTAAAHLGAELAVALCAFRGGNDTSPPELTTGSVVIGRDGAVRVLPPLPAVSDVEAPSWIGNEFRFGVGLLARGKGEARWVSLVAETVNEWLAPPALSDPYRDGSFHDGQATRSELESLLQSSLDAEGSARMGLDDFARRLSAIDETSHGAQSLARVVNSQWERVPDRARWG